MSKKYPEYELVQKCLRQIEEKLAWGQVEQWHNEVFEELSVLIQESTNVLLSTTTLKRVWGRVKYNSSPSISTLNTLAQYAGYTNWRAFKQEQTIIVSSVKAKSGHSSRNNKRIIFTSSALLTIVFLSLFSMIGLPITHNHPIDYSNIQFSSHPITQGLPNSVVFDFDLKTVDSDSIYIQQFWDPNKTIKLEPGQIQATGIYYFPGYFRAKLLIEGEIVKEHDLFIKSKNWEATLDYEPIPKFVRTQDIIDKGLKFKADIIEEIKRSKEPLVSTYHWVDNFEYLDADNITVSSTLRNVYSDKWAICQTTRIVLLGTSGALIIPFSIPGCVSDIGVMLNDVYISGKKHDLSPLGINLSEYKNIKIEVVTKQVQIWVNDSKVYTQSYTKSVGRLVGIRYRFLGAGEVQHLTIMNAQGKVVKDENFIQPF